MSKKDVLKTLNKKETSYSTMFAELGARGIIISDKSNKGLLKAAPEDQWDLDAISWHEIPGADSIQRDRNFSKFFDFDKEKNNYKLKEKYRNKPGELE